MGLWGPPGIWPGSDKAAAVPIGFLKYYSLNPCSCSPSSGHFSHRSLGPALLSLPAIDRTWAIGHDGRAGRD
jgi:hypothetical protein